MQFVQEVVGCDTPEEATVGSAAVATAVGPGSLHGLVALCSHMTASKKGKKEVKYGEQDCNEAQGRVITSTNAGLAPAEPPIGRSSCVECSTICHVSQ